MKENEFPVKLASRHSTLEGSVDSLTQKPISSALPTPEYLAVF